MTTNNYVSALSIARHPGITSAAIHPSTNVSPVLATFADTSCIGNALLVGADEMPRLAEILRSFEAGHVRHVCPTMEINVCNDYRCTTRTTQNGIPRGITIKLLAVVRHGTLQTRNFRQIIALISFISARALQRDNRLVTSHHELRASS